MAILKKIKSVASQALNKASSVVKSVVSTVKNTLGKNVIGANIASAGSLISSNKGETSPGLDFTGNRQRIDTITGKTTPYGASGSWTPNTSSNNSKSSNTSSGFIGPVMPGSGGFIGPVKTITSSKQDVGRSSQSNMSSFAGDTSYGATSISSLSMGGSSGVGSLGSGVSSPVVTPSSPGSVNPKLDTTALAGRTAGLYERQEDGTFKEVKEDEQSIIERKAKEQMDLYKNIVGVEPSVEDDREVRQAVRERQRIQEALRGPTSELNAVIAQQNKDLLQLRQTGSQEGVTEAVYGGQQSAVNYNAAIRALPLQASIASLQGDLELATDYLTQLRQVKSDQIKRQYEYRKNMFESIQGVIKTEDQRAYDEKKTENERAYKEEQKLVDFQNELSTMVMQNAPESVRSNVVSRVNNAGTIQEAIQAAGKYGVPANTQLTQLDNGDTVMIDKNTGKVISNIGGAKPVSQGSQGVLSSLPTSIQGKVISIANGFGDKPNIKKYIEAVDSVNIVNGIDPKSKNPADHQQIIYAFAKALDPDSAVKEGEYETIRKYAQSTLSRYKKEITNAINGTGFLSENAIKNIQTTMKNTLDSRKSVYTNSLNDTKKVINNIAGSNVADDIMMDYEGGIDSGQSTNSSNIDYTSTLDNIFK